MPYKTYGPTSLHEIFGDFVVYRNLVPADERLPSIAGIRDHLGPDLGPENVTLPRKAEPDHGRVVLHVDLVTVRMDGDGEGFGVVIVAVVVGVGAATEGGQGQHGQKDGARECPAQRMGRHGDVSTLT